MKKLLNLGLILASLIGYLEWGSDQHAFLGQTEYQLLFEQDTLKNFMHPFVILPLLGQLLLFITLFQKTPGKVLTYTGIACLGLLLGFIFIIGIIEQNISVASSTLPFIVLSILTIRAFRKNKTLPN